ncbi:hypothetical protein ABK040_005230 [Willaertia magna]
MFCFWQEQVLANLFNYDSSGDDDNTLTSKEIKEQQLFIVKEMIGYPLEYIVKYYSYTFNTLKNYTLNKENIKEYHHYLIIRKLFYLLEEQLNPICFSLQNWWLIDNYIPIFFAKSIFYLFYNNCNENITELPNKEILENEYEENEDGNKEIINYLIKDLKEENEECVNGCKECCKRLSIILQNNLNNENKEFIKGLFFIYLNFLYDRYCDTEKGKNIFKLFYNELLQQILQNNISLQHTLQNENLQIDKCDDLLQQSTSLSEYLTLQKDKLKINFTKHLTNQLINNWLQYQYKYKIKIPPQLRQLSLPFKNQTAFGDCQELNLFELFIHHLLYNTKTQRYNLFKEINKDLQNLLLKFNNNPKFINCLSFRKKWHKFLQGKPLIFQYVNRNYLNIPNLDYEVEVSIYNLLIAVEYFFNIELKEFKFIKNKLNLQKCLQIRENNNNKLNEEEYEMLRISKIRLCLEKGFKKEKNIYEKCFKELSNLLSTDERKINIILDKNKKQNHNLIELTITNNCKEDDFSYSIIADQYGAHVATYVPKRLDYCLELFNGFEN